MDRFVPSLAWLRAYDRRRDLPGDLGAGLTVAVMLVPQGMAYAMLAGLPPIVGLYASVFPLLAYAFLGTSRQLAVGPVAMVSLLVATSVGAIAEPGTAPYVALAVVLAGMVGVLQLTMGVLRLGALVSLLSHPVISGFTSAAAIIIGLSQLEHLLGADIPRSPHLHELAMSAAARAGDTHLLTFAVGAGAILLLVALKRWNRRFPGALAVVALGTLATWGLDLHERGVGIVGHVPAGLPSPSLPSFTLAQLGQLTPAALTIGLVGFMESISVAKAFARKNGYEVDADQELRSLGVANLVGFVFGAYPVTGGFSRTAVNAQAGARTGLASAIAAAVIGLSLLFFTPLFYFLPNAVLAAIVMTAVAGLVDARELVHLWHVKRSDAGLLLLTFGMTLFLGIEEGIASGVAASLALFVYRRTRPHHAALGRLPGTAVYVELAANPAAERRDAVLVWRFDASLYFANASFFRDELERALAAHPSARAVVLDASGINELDASAEATLREVHRRLRAKGVSLHVAAVKPAVRDVMARGGFVAVLGEARLCPDVHGAVQAAERDAAASQGSDPDPASATEGLRSTPRLGDAAPERTVDEAPSAPITIAASGSSRA